VKLTPGGVALGAVGLAIGFAAVIQLREATLSTHQRMPRDSTVVVELSADTKGGETDQSLPEMVEALFLACRLEVTSDLVAPLERVGEGRFRAQLRPAMDETNRRQFRGCLEDWTVDHLQVDQVVLTNRLGGGA
jgi:hypothetical protein